jgi:hypothetical protein
VPNSPATIANEAVSAAAPPNAVTTRRRKQNTTKTVPLGSIDTNLKRKAPSKQKHFLNNVGAGQIKTVSTEDLSNKGKNKVTKKTSWHGNIFNKVKKNLSRL